MRISVLTSIRRRPFFVLLVITLLIVEYVARKAGGPAPSLAVVRNPFAAIAAATVFFRYIIYDRGGQSRRWIIYLIPVTCATALAAEGVGAPMALLFLDTLCALGALGVFGFVLAAFRTAGGQERARCFGQLMDALMLPLSASMASFGMWSTSRLNPVYDGRVYAFEEILRVRVSALVVRTYAQLGPLSAIATGCYDMLAMAIVLVAAGEKRFGRERDVLTAVVAAGACGFALYLVCPVVGTHEAFGPFFPNALSTVSSDGSLITAPLGVPRNGMPSLHTVWALIIWFNAQRLPVAVRRGSERLLP